MGIHGQGTRVRVRTKRKDGSIRERIRIAVTMPDGRRQWKTVRNDREADRVQQALVEARELELDPSLLARQTLEAYLRSWTADLATRKRRRPRERTRLGYVALVEQRILPELGRYRLNQLTRRRIQSWVDGMDGAPATVGNAFAVLRAALAPLVGDVLPANPAVGVELPDKPRSIGKPLTADEAHRLLEATAGMRLHALWRLGIITGLREGELLGLERDGLEGSTLRVKHQLQRIDHAWVLGPTKVARGLEAIELDDDTVAIVRAHLARTAAERRPSWRYFGLMFVTEEGEPYHESRILDEFRRALAAAGIPSRRFHDLRHTANRLLKDAGVDREIRKARLGHVTDEMSERYGGASTIADRAAAELLADAIG